VRSSWADAPGTSTSISTRESCNEKDGFQFQDTRKKRRRTQTRSQLHGGQLGALTNPATHLGRSAAGQSLSDLGGPDAKPKTAAAV
jgi:hypothetical protein